jgi:heme-degrading monooxygenase HmoA
MSVIVRVVVPGDTEQFRTWITNDIDNIVALSQEGKAAGAIHHQFAIGDGEVLILDEWESAEAFEAFFARPEIAAAMQNGGAQGPPDVAFYEALETADRF